MTNDIEVTLNLDRKMFYKEESNFGIFSIKVLDIDDWDSINDNEYITIKGSMPDLERGATYIANLTPKDDPKYGMGYLVNTIYQKALSTKDEIKTFLETILTPRQAESIFNAYPDGNVLDLIKTNGVDHNLIHGVGEKTLATIKEKVIKYEKYQKAIVELSAKYSIPYNAIIKLTDRYGSPDLLIQKLETNPYILTNINGYGFLKADEIALKMGIEKTSEHRIKACILHILDEEANNGHCWMSVSTMINKSLKLLGVKVIDVREVLNDDSANEDYEVDGSVIYKKKYKHVEVELGKNIDRLLDIESQIRIDNIEEKIAKVEERQGFLFTEEQKKAIYLAVEKNVLVVVGKAGTGKTSVIKGIVEVLKSVEDLLYATCALSGKASQRIQESTGLNSSTIHRLLVSDKEGSFQHNQFNQLIHDVVILDEASMVNSRAV